MANKQSDEIAQLLSVVRAQAEDNKQLVEAVSSLKEQVAQVMAEKSATMGLATVKVLNAPTKEIEAGIKAIYTKRKYNKFLKEEGCYRIASIEVTGVEVTKGGHSKVSLKKTLYNGEVKEHPIIIWSKKK